ncbi:GNAT family N-acetyltransferase [Thalassotalea sp. M1531]|uniref:GNAT family N-acetyltransferase n=1 Tax=Thalassotalea algicola TaxID=2716224 RepID=A0A7Y0Q8T0_9GAMM|nr:GNAT family N-acetyltransferase [Thalassotalea algicola]NMP33561.1 GNAT family N-acetyltransferase [Thalassotalea algicola]
MVVSFKLVEPKQSPSCIEQNWLPYFEQQFSAMPIQVASQLSALQVKAKVRDYFNRWPNLNTYTIIRQGESTGCILIAAENDVLHIIDLIVLTQFQNQGIAKSTLEQAIALASERQCSTVQLSVAKENHAVNLYRAFEFDVIDESVSHLSMELKLT